MIAFEDKGTTILIVINPTASLKCFTVPANGMLSVTDKNRGLEEKSCSEGDVAEIYPESVTTFVLR